MALATETKFSLASENALKKFAESTVGMMALGAGPAEYCGATITLDDLTITVSGDDSARELIERRVSEMNEWWAGPSDSDPAATHAQMQYLSDLVWRHPGTARFLGVSFDGENLYLTNLTRSQASRIIDCILNVSRRGT